MGFVFNVENSLLYVAGRAGVTGEVPTHQFAVPRPIVFGISGRVDAYIATTRLDVALKSVLLSSVEYVTSCTKKHHRSILLQVRFVEFGGIFGSVHRKTFALAHLDEGNFARIDGRVAENGCFAKHQNTWCLCTEKPSDKQQHQKCHRPLEEGLNSWVHDVGLRNQKFIVWKLHNDKKELGFYKILTEGFRRMGE